MFTYEELTEFHSILHAVSMDYEDVSYYTHGLTSDVDNSTADLYLALHNAKRLAANAAALVTELNALYHA